MDQRCACVQQSVLFDNCTTGRQRAGAHSVMLTIDEANRMIEGEILEYFLSASAQIGARATRFRRFTDLDSETTRPLRSKDTKKDYKRATHV